MTTNKSRSTPLPEPRVRMPRSIRRFLNTEASGGVVLLIAATVAIIWANSPWKEGYQTFFHTKVALSAGPFHIEDDLVHWINDALMAIFFFVVGLEIKRELVVGDLRSWRRASLPAIAALGGMVVPAVLYYLVNIGHLGAHGWGVPMATDIAFAVGVLALLGSRIPHSLKLFLLTLAIVDDIGAIVVIAIFYSNELDWIALGIAVGLIGVVVLMRRMRITAVPLYFVVGSVIWLAVFESGVHATIAGVVLGLLAPARPLAAADVVREWVVDLQDDPDPHTTREMTALARNTVSVAERLEEMLHPYTSYLIIPLFALANAGVEFSASAISSRDAGRVALGVIVGLVAGKMIGVTVFAVVADRLGIGELPVDTTPLHMVGIGAVAGIGFTVSLFIADLAFKRPELAAAAKIGIFGASILASAIGVTILLIATRGSRAED
ncbi:MAG: Na+/H+ antiporter NhaA [Acidimicrobiales bacterium]